MISKKQIIVISSVAGLMVILLFLDVRGLVKPKEDREHVEATQPASSISLESVSELAKPEISASQLRAIEELEHEFSEASVDQKSAIAGKLAARWSDLDKHAPAAFYYEQLASGAPSYASWLKAGDTFTGAYQESQDSLLKPSLVEKAIAAYKEALELKSDGIEAKTGLGVAYVSGSSNPMQGIQLLREVVAAEPKNVKANRSLGLFSVQSGQFEKAVARFKTVLSVEPSPETWFYLASSYENLGKKKEAIDAYERAKDLGKDPSLSKFVDEKIAELSK